MQESSTKEPSILHFPSTGVPTCPYRKIKLPLQAFRPVICTLYAPSVVCLSADTAVGVHVVLALVERRRRSESAATTFTEGPTADVLSWHYDTGNQCRSCARRSSGATGGQAARRSYR